jgi:allantoicase
MLMPYPAADMGDGWETKRRRVPGHDWAIVRLGIRAMLSGFELDTSHFKGNYPDQASIEAAVVADDAHGVSADTATRATAEWREVVRREKLAPDHLHRFAAGAVPAAEATHIRLNIYPDGGVSRFRVFGITPPGLRADAIARQLNAMDQPEACASLSYFCAAPDFIDGVAARRPFGSGHVLRQAVESAITGVDEAGWREAFRHHPRIGERSAERPQLPASAAASAREQHSVSDASAAERAALAAANRDYEQKFGHVFLVSAAGKSTREILEALRARMANDSATELRVAVEEQKRIARLRLERLLG